MSEIAQVFEIDITVVEEWSRILEENEIIKIHYPAIGDPELVKIENLFRSKVFSKFFF